MELTDTAVIARAEGILGADVDGHHVLLSNDLDYIGLDPVGRRVWEELVEPQTIPALVGVFTSEYEVDPATCRTDVEAFVASLIEHKLVVLT